MTMKNDVLKMLEENRGVPVSGEVIAEGLGVSRTAVWKVISALKEQGYPIDSAPKRGYVLSESSPMLSREAVLTAMSAGFAQDAMPLDDPAAQNGIRNTERFDASFAPELLSVYRSIDSTNAEAKRRIADVLSPEDIPYGTVIVADEQTAGRGRRSRDFYSPAAGSIYISFILKPAAMLENSLLITIMAAVSVCRAIEGVMDGSEDVLRGLNQGFPKIKWVNDIYINEKKVCGILTEAVSDVESGSIESLVLGIGININVPEAEFPEEIRGTAGALDLNPGMRGLFAATLINEVLSLYEKLTTEPEGAAYIMNEYRKRSLMTNRNITVIKGAGDTAVKRKAVSQGIADDGSLLVEYRDGTTENLRSGEVSIKI